MQTTDLCEIAQQTSGNIANQIASISPELAKAGKPLISVKFSPDAKTIPWIDGRIDGTQSSTPNSEVTFSPENLRKRANLLEQNQLQNLLAQLKLISSEQQTNRAAVAAACLAVEAQINGGLGRKPTPDEYANLFNVLKKQGYRANIGFRPPTT